ncbi:MULTISPECIES: DUF7144 family membrane protein [unclassified Streptomyces]|uniref:DUF7144 family membrane protein n=1 Tax=unclassified Streptomyces TaxID=2593676 RepID=UPI003B635F9C
MACCPTRLRARTAGRWHSRHAGRACAVIGTVVTLAGFALFKRVTWARVVGVIAALCAAPRRDASA